MSQLHRRLHDPRAAEQPLPSYLQELCTELLDATGARNVVCLIDADDIRLDLTKLTALSLMLVELVTNSLKHAFKDREGGTISINLKRLPSGLVSLSVGDDGPGLPSVNNQASPGLGFKIIQGLASQLGAELQVAGSGGSMNKVIFTP
jgi:two-component sensor histidine kinase